MKIVLDTNVLLSGSLWNGEARKVIRLIENKKVEGYTSSAILNELFDVLTRSDIIEKKSIEKFNPMVVITKITQICRVVEPDFELNVVQNDPDDNKILECAVFAKVDYLLTYDASHLLPIKEFQGIKIITPTEFLKLINI